MATAHLSAGYDHDTSPNQGTTADGFCVGSAMLGAAGGALTGVAAAGSTFEYAPVLIGTLGVILGSVAAGMIGRHLVFPTWAALACRGARHQN